MKNKKFLKEISSKIIAMKKVGLTKEEIKQKLLYESFKYNISEKQFNSLLEYSPTKSIAPTTKKNAAVGDINITVRTQKNIQGISVPGMQHGDVISFYVKPGMLEKLQLSGDAIDYAFIKGTAATLKRVYGGDIIKNNRAMTYTLIFSNGAGVIIKSNSIGKAKNFILLSLIFCVSNTERSDFQAIKPISLNAIKGISEMNDAIISSYRKGQFNESVFSDRFEDFLSKGWQKPTEKSFVSLVNKAKKKIIENGEKGKEYLKDLYTKNKNTLVDSCTNEFVEELERLSNEYMTEKKEPKKSDPAYPKKIKLKTDIWNYDAETTYDKDAYLAKKGATLTWDDVQKAYKSGKKFIRPGLLHPSTYEVVGEKNKLSDKMPSLKKESVYDANEKQKQLQKQTGPVSETPGFNTKTKKTWNVNGPAQGISEKKNINEEPSFEVEKTAIKIYSIKGPTVVSSNLNKIISLLSGTYGVKAKIKSGNEVNEVKVISFPISQLIHLKEDLKKINSSLDVDAISVPNVNHNLVSETEIEESSTNRDFARFGKRRVFETDDIEGIEKVIDEATNELVNFHKNSNHTVDPWEDINNTIPNSHTVIEEDPQKGKQAHNKKANIVDPFDTISMNTTPNSKTLIEEDPDKGPTIGDKKAKEIDPWKEFEEDFKWIEETVQNPTLTDMQHNVLDESEIIKKTTYKNKTTNPKPEGKKKGITDKVKEQEDKDESLEKTDMQFDSQEQWEEKVKEVHKNVKFEDEIYAIIAYCGDEEVGEWREGIGGKLWHSMFDELDPIQINESFPSYTQDQAGISASGIVGGADTPSGLLEDDIPDNEEETWEYEGSEGFEDNCENCGTPIIRSTHGDYHCKNCGCYDDGELSECEVVLHEGYSVDTKGIFDDDGLRIGEDIPGYGIIQDIKRQSQNSILVFFDNNDSVKFEKDGWGNWVVDDTKENLEEEITTANMAVYDTPVGGVHKKELEEIDRFFKEFVIKNCNIKGYIKEGKFDLQSYLKSRPYGFQQQLVEAFKKSLKENPEMYQDEIPIVQRKELHSKEDVEEAYQDIYNEVLEELSFDYDSITNNTIRTGEESSLELKAEREAIKRFSVIYGKNPSDYIITLQAQPVEEYPDFEEDEPMEESEDLIPEIGNEEEIHDHLRLDEGPGQSDNFNNAFRQIVSQILELERREGGTDAHVVDRLIKQAKKDFSLTYSEEMNLRVDIFDWRNEHG